MTTAPLPRRDGPYRRGETALLLVDMQRIWLEPGADPDHPELGREDYFYRQTAAVTIPNQERLLKALRPQRVTELGRCDDQGVEAALARVLLDEP